MALILVPPVDHDQAHRDQFGGMRVMAGWLNSIAAVNSPMVSGPWRSRVASSAYWLGWMDRPACSATWLTSACMRSASRFRRLPRNSGPAP